MYIYTYNINTHTHTLYNNNNILLHLYSTFLGTQCAFQGGGGGGDDATAAILRQNAEVTPLLFSKDILGFLMTTESQHLGLTSHPKDSAFLQYCVPITILRR